MFQKYGKWFILVGVLVAAAALLVACSAPEPEPCPDCPEPEACPEAEKCPEPEECPAPEECPVPMPAPNEEAWKESGHNAAEDEAFRHWDEDGEVEAGCAKCHSGGGLGDFLGLDGSEVGVVDNNQPIDTTVGCTTCHNEATVALTSVVFPSGAEITGLGMEAVCMNCHQGRASGAGLNATFEELGVDDDVVSEELGFSNIHYYAAAVSRYGKLVGGGYEYAGQSYDALFEHVSGYETCQECHDPHALELKIDECSMCHEGVAGVEDLRDVRMISSLVDYDGDGDVAEGVYYEIMGLQEMLYTAIQAYGTEVGGVAIAYESHSYPYFFTDTDGDGVAGEEEANYGNKYAAWTPRLLKAAYNYQTSLKDPGAYAHGGKYIIQLLYDSIADLNSMIATPVDLSSAHRDDHGHFAGSEEAFRHWDEDGEVSGSCARCHSSAGLPDYYEWGSNVGTEIANGFMCETCHDESAWPARYEFTSVEFPSGASLSFADSTDSNLCLNCHQGRSSSVSLDRSLVGLEKDVIAAAKAAVEAGEEGAEEIDALDPDVIYEKLGFTNIHYFAAGATLFGNDAMGAYQYAGKEYLGQFAHVAGFETCTACHDAHTLVLNEASCAGCHGVEDPHAIRGASSAADYDGDGDVDEGIAGELETMGEKLYAAIQLYSVEVVESPIAYESHSYPYFFKDTDGNGMAEGDEASYGNKYAFSPRLVKAAFNYQYLLKDPGAFAHNGKYVLQVLYDTLEDLGTVVDVDMAGMVRP